MNKKQEAFEKMLSVSLTSSDEIINDELLDIHAKQLRLIPNFCNLTDEEVKEVINDYKATHFITHDLGTQIVDKGHKKWFLQNKSNYSMEFWECYREYLINQKGWSDTTVNTMDVMLDDLVDLLGNPNGDTLIKRKGLIIGDVQSGKTGNYIGLINKAVDVGYNVIILLTGTIEKLRVQTQQRIDEGFLGLDSGAMYQHAKGDNSVGVGKAGTRTRTMNPLSLTSTYKDFSNATANGVLQNLNKVSNPVILVIKKNVRILNNLNEWLNTGSINGNNSINASLLLIDDESDYASVNTKKLDDETQTATPTQILSLLKKFKNYSYVGFTATPYANIFIQPETDEEMLSPTSLFPENYIYCLKSPSNYIGAKRIFGDEDEADKSDMLISLGDMDKDENIYPGCIEDILPMKHKKDTVICELPDTLMDAINCFFIVNVIRDLRNDKTAHRTMMINMSRFINVQENIGLVVNDYLKEKQMNAKLYGKLSFDDASSHFEDILISLKKNYSSLYDQIENIEEKLISNLYEAIVSIKVQVVNSGNKANQLDYTEYKDSGYRVIAIGGLGLARGLTLEDLSISYFYRNSSTYDTLMQMGRWFGYRNRYDDLCRIWMTEKSINWYSEITKSTEELKDSIELYQGTNLTPKDFGLRVRQDATSLLVTARNKMRATKKVTQKISLSSDVLQSKYLYTDINTMIHNKNVMTELINDLSDYEVINMNGRKGYRNVNKSLVSKFISKFIIPDENIYVKTDFISDFISNGYKGNELNNWDICFVSGKSNTPVYIDSTNQTTINKSLYTFKVVDDKKHIIHPSKSIAKLGNNTDMEFGLTDNQIEELKNRKNNEKIPAKGYFLDVDPIKDRNPLLSIYNLSLKNFDGDGEELRDEYIDNVNSNDLIGFVIGIPNLEDEESKLVTYVLNPTAIIELYGEKDDGGEDDE